MSRSHGAALMGRLAARSFRRELLARQTGSVVADIRNVPRYLLCALTGAALICGLLSLWGLRGDGSIPRMSPLGGLDPYRISSPRCIADETDAASRWNGLAPALAILDRVNPAVAKWMREKHAKGLVVFGERGNRDSVPPWPSTTGSGAESS